MRSLSLPTSSCSSGTGPPCSIANDSCDAEVLTHGLSVKTQRLADMLDLHSLVPLVDGLHYFIHRYIPPCHDPSVPRIRCARNGRITCGLSTPHPAQSGELPWPCQVGNYLGPDGLLVGIYHGSRHVQITRQKRTSITDEPR